MGRVPIATENRTGEGADRFPRVELTQKGQKTRFTIIEQPWGERVHYLKCPQFNDDGTTKMATKTRKDGTSYDDLDLEFVSSPICIGDDAIIRDKGLDVANCPACEAAEKSGGDIPGPVQRFAVNVAQYQLKGTTFDIGSPFSAAIRVWVFTGRMYDEIEGFQQEIGDLRQHDITLECEDAYWKRNKIGFKMEPGYKHGTKAYMQELLTTPGNKATEAQLKDACGRDMPRQRMQDDCDYVLRQYRKHRNEGADPAYATSGAADLAGGIDDLLADEGPAEAKVETKAAEVAAAVAGEAVEENPFAEFTEAGTTNPTPETEDAREAAKAEEEAPAAEGDNGDFNFDDLMTV